MSVTDKRAKFLVYNIGKANDSAAFIQHTNLIASEIKQGVMSTNNQAL